MTKNKFFTKINKHPNGCWIWLGATNGRYGIYGSSKSKLRGYIHRWAWEAFNEKQIPNGFFILHSCDQPLCANPDHLSPGTAKENTQDMYKKGRAKSRPGMLAPSSIRKLTDSDIAEIRSSTMRGIDLAIKFNVSHSHIRKIRCGAKWKHI